MHAALLYHQNSARLRTCHVMGGVHARARRLAGIGAHVMSIDSCVTEGVQPSGSHGKARVRYRAESCRRIRQKNIADDRLSRRAPAGRSSGTFGELLGACIRPSAPPPARRRSRLMSRGRAARDARLGGHQSVGVLKGPRAACPCLCGTVSSPFRDSSPFEGRSVCLCCGVIYSSDAHSRSTALRPSRTATFGGGGDQPSR